MSRGGIVSLDARPVSNAHRLIVFRYDGAESPLERISLAAGPNRTASGFEWAAEIGSMALRSCVLHLETGGARLVSALLERKNAPVPLPVDAVADLVACCVRHLAADGKKCAPFPSRSFLDCLLMSSF